MAIPAYLWLKDDGGADIKGAVDVQDREGSIEILGFGHGLHLPTDNMTGKITVHAFIVRWYLKRSLTVLALIYTRPWQKAKR